MISPSREEQIEEVRTARGQVWPESSQCLCLGVLE